MKTLDVTNSIIKVNDCNYKIHKVLVTNIGGSYKQETNILTFDKVIVFKQPIGVQESKDNIFENRYDFFRFLDNKRVYSTKFFLTDKESVNIVSHIMYYLNIIYNMFPNSLLFFDNIETVRMVQTEGQTMRRT